MRIEISQRSVVAVGFAALLAVAGCAGHDRDSVPTAESPAAQVQPVLVAEEYVEGEAVVQAIDAANRTVTLQNAEGETITVKLPADVDLKRLKVGNTVLIGLLQSASLRILPPGSAALGATLATGSTAPGRKSGRAWGQQLTVVSAITAIDLVNHTVTVQSADGAARTVVVKDPQMQQRMSNLHVGDLVELTYSEAIAARVLPKS